MEEDRLEGVEEDKDKLDELDGGEVLLPPEVRLEGGPGGSEQVVEVHQRVHSGVEEGAKAALSTADEPGPPPTEEGQGAVVDHMKEGEVGELLPSDEEEGVEEVDELGEVVPPSQVDGLPRHRALAVVHGLTMPAGREIDERTG